MGMGRYKSELHAIRSIQSNSLSDYLVISQGTCDDTADAVDRVQRKRAEAKKKKKKKKNTHFIKSQKSQQRKTKTLPEEESYIGFLRCFSLLVRSDGAPKNPTSTAFPRQFSFV
jgi:hypothetical protein